MKSIEVLAHRVLKNMDTGQEISIFSAVPPGNWEPVTKGYTWETVSNSGSVRRGLGRQAAKTAKEANDVAIEFAKNIPTDRVILLNL